VGLEGARGDTAAAVDARTAGPGQHPVPVRREGWNRSPFTMEVAMVPILSLWLPILLSAVLVFVMSAVIHMVLPYHRTDFEALGAEDQVMDALRAAGVQPGEYMFPYAGSPDRLKDPEFLAKAQRGPVGMLTTWSGETFGMGKQLLQWFLYCVVISGFAAYVAGRALDPGADYLSVFRFSGSAAFGAYALGLPQASIWFRRKWSSTAKSMFDGLVYALLTAGAFGWLWPA